MHDDGATKADGVTFPKAWTLRNCTATESAPKTAPETEPATEPQLSRKRECGNGAGASALVESPWANHRATTKECVMDVDRVEPAVGGFLEVVLRDGWRGLLSASEVAAITPRREGGCAIHLKSAGPPILVSVPVELVIDAMEGAADATAT